MKLAYTIEEASAESATPRSTMYEDIRDGHLKVVKRGRRTYITHEELVRYVSTPRPPRTRKAAA